MSVTSVFSNISNGFQILYSLFFEQMSEFVYRNPNNAATRKSNTDNSTDNSMDKQEMAQDHTAHAPTEHATTDYSTTEQHENINHDWIKISLNSILTIADVEELHNQLKQYLGKRVQLSGKNVQRVDTASLQLLLAFMLKADVTVCWVDYSSHLCESARLLGISTPLGLPTEVHG